MLKQTLAAAVTAVACAGSAMADDGLADLLRYVPLQAVEAGPQGMVSYVDLDAIRGLGLLGVPMLDRFGWSAEDRELAALSRSRAMPAMFQNYIQFYGIHRLATRDYLGFGWEDIGQVIGFGMPPDAVVVATGAPAVTDAAAIGAALTGRGFAAEQRGGHPFWGRLQDNEHDMMNRDPADPLRGGIGGSARAGVVDGAFVAGANWPAVDAVVAATAGSGGALASSPDFAALAHALAQPVTGEGEFLQAHLMAGVFDESFVLSLLRVEDEAALADLRARLLADDQGPRTPRYRAIALGDRQEGDLAVGVVALVYASRDDATLAIETVPQAVASQVSIATDAPFSEVLPFDLTTSVIEIPDEGRYVALFGFADVHPPRTGPAAPVRTPFSRLVDMLYRGDMGPFVGYD